MIRAQNDNNARNMPQCPHFHFGIYPCLHQTFIWCLQGLNTPAETVLPWSPGPWRSPGLWPWRPAAAVHSSFPCSSWEITSDLLIWLPVWLKKRKVWVLSLTNQSLLCSKHGQGTGENKRQLKVSAGNNILNRQNSEGPSADQEETQSSSKNSEAV